jgi:hypothetical protein
MNTYTIVNGHCRDNAANCNNNWMPAHVLALALWVASKGNTFCLQDCTQQKQSKREESNAVNANEGEAARSLKKSKTVSQIKEWLKQ